jgi:2-polyprenyl-3-methyl-5-hydroxy-6-metoxy-1,4-benzoquinol methylase
MEAQEWYWQNGQALRSWNNNYASLSPYKNQVVVRRAAQIATEIKNVFLLHSLDHINILEIGAGTGDLCQVLSSMLSDMNLSHSIHIYEPQIDSPLANINNENIYIHFEPLTVETQLVTRFQFTIMIEVIEHIQKPDDLFLILKNISSSIFYIFLTTPNQNSLDCKLLLKASDVFGFDHCSVFSPLSMQCLMSKHGFTVQSLTTPGKRDVSIIIDYLITFIPHKSLRIFMLRLAHLGKPVLDFIQLLIVRFKLSSHMSVLATKSTFS